VRCLERGGVGGCYRHEDEEDAEGEGPHGDAVGAGLDLSLGARGATAGRYGLTGDDDRTAAVDSLVVLPHGAGGGCLHRLSFVVPAGLADGLALKELRYVYFDDSPLA
jgi:hypothetical protein